jgi:hypothetical protein
MPFAHRRHAARSTAIVLEYDLVPCDVALKDVARFVGASLDGTTVRVVTRLDSVREALRQRSATNGGVITYEDQFRVMADDGLSSEYTLDLQRANF